MLESGEQGLSAVANLSMNADRRSAAFLEYQGTQALRRGDFALARRVLEDAVAIKRRLLRCDSPELGASLNNLGVVIAELGDFGTAITVLNDALTIQRQAFGEYHPEVAGILNNIAGAYEGLGDYIAARRRYELSLSIKRQVHGEHDPEIAYNLYNLGNISRYLGDFVGAITAYNEALTICQHGPSADHSFAGRILNGLGAAYHLIGDQGYARHYYDAALLTWRLDAAPNPRDVSTTLVNLGILSTDTGNFGEGKCLIAEALAIARRTLGDWHPRIAMMLLNLARVSSALLAYPAAEQHCREALEIQTRAFGRHHPDIGHTRIELARALAMARKSVEEAIDVFREAVEIGDWQLDQVLGAGSERQRLAFVMKIQSDVHGLVSLALDYGGERPELIAEALDLALRRKAIVFDVLGLDAAARRASQDDVVASAFGQLRAARERLVGAWFMPVEKAFSTQQLRTLEIEVEQREAYLTEVLKISERQVVPTCNRYSIASHLPPETALIEFVAVNRYHYISRQSGDVYTPLHYAAFVLHPNGDNALIDLGAALPIIENLRRLRSALRDPAPGPDAATGPAEPAGVSLWRRLIDPLRPFLGSTTRLIIAPDDALAQLPFEILVSPQGEWACETYCISYVTTGRDILRWLPPARPSEPPLVVGDPDFSLGLKSPMPSLQEAGTLDHPSPRIADLEQPFRPLPGTRDEATAVCRLIGPDAELLVGAEAAERRVKDKCCGSHGSAPQLIHLATHGFFLTDQGLADRTPANRAGGLTFEPQQTFENPLLRSGIALAGAETWRLGETPPPDAEDGLLTALDIASFDLEGTELVILSACGTGLGPIHRGEGVFGLQRAFLLAGARSVVMSLWDADDRETAQLMSAFYSHLKRGMNKADALRRAQAELRRDLPDPYFCGAFILIGDPSPIKWERNSLGCS